MKYDAWQQYRENLSVKIGDNVILHFYKEGFWKGVLVSVSRLSIVVGAVPFGYQCIEEISLDEDVEEPKEDTIANMARKLLDVEGW